MYNNNNNNNNNNNESIKSNGGNLSFRILKFQRGKTGWTWPG